jgi:hypothetical protein
LVGQGPFFDDALVAITIDWIADAGDRALLRHAGLTAGQIAKMRQGLTGLPPMPRMADSLERGERLLVLDCALWASRQAAVDPRKTAERVGVPLASGIDWNIVLRMVNSWYDRAVTAIRKPTRAERQIAMDELDRDMSVQVTAAKNWTFLPSLIVNRREAISKRFGSIFVALMTPAAGAAWSAEDRWRMQSELTKLAFALAAYHAKHSRYPANLTTLVPKYLKEVPKDIFNDDGDLHYAWTGDGYLLYSVGENGKDDGGKGRDDAKNGEGWDDLAVRMSGGKP